ncbi:MAG: ABC transporter permease [Actinobacteria bacterium]|nr:ABC transporter permease [Actinomycetota bacterium]
MGILKSAKPDQAALPEADRTTRSPRPSSGRRFGSVRLSTFLNGTELTLLAVVIAVAAAMSIWQPQQFATTSNLQNMAQQGAVLAIVAMGQMFPLLVGGFDISVGSLIGVSSVVGVEVMVHHGLVPGLIAGILSAGVLGLVNGFLIGRLELSPFIVTLGMLSFARGLALTISGGAPITGTPKSFEYFGAHEYGPIPGTVVVAAGVAILVALLLTVSRAGLYLYATGSNNRAARLAGVSVTRYTTLAYVISGLLAGVAGLVLSSRLASGQPTLGGGYELQSIAVAVIGGVAIGGGKGRLQGVLLGVVFLTMVTSGLNIGGVDTFVQQMVIGAIIVLAVLWDRVRIGSVDRLLRTVARRKPGGAVESKA